MFGKLVYDSKIFIILCFMSVTKKSHSLYCVLCLWITFFCILFIYKQLISNFLKLILTLSKELSFLSLHKKLKIIFILLDYMKLMGFHKNLNSIETMHSVWVQLLLNFKSMNSFCIFCIDTHITKVFQDLFDSCILNWWSGDRFYSNYFLSEISHSYLENF